jgi:hypothetical protein
MVVAADRDGAATDISDATFSPQMIDAGKTIAAVGFLR